MKTIIIKHTRYITLFTLIIIVNMLVFLKSSIIKAQYIESDIEVPVFEGAEPETKFIYWDISEVNTQNNRLDLTVGLNQHGEDEDYINANWYKNLSNNNFNIEDTNTRIIFANNLTNEITGLYLPNFIRV